MLEELCRSSFYTACQEKIHRDGLVYLKGRPKPDRPLKNFKIDQYFSTDWHFLPIEVFSGRGQRKSSLKRKSWVWFNENASRIRNAFIEKQYGGDLALAMLLNGSFDALFNDFLTYFADRRSQFMEQTEITLKERTQELAKQGKSPQSHGGVANLLKVLTKTMHDQGSSVYSIAKVQYAVCMQAGIYIPEEFLTDVLVATEIMEE